MHPKPFDMSLVDYYTMKTFCYLSDTPGKMIKYRSSIPDESYRDCSSKDVSIVEYENMDIEGNIQQDN